jgi:hypothetical protein
VIWIPLLYIGTSTQFRLSLVNLNPSNYHTEFNHGDAGKTRIFDVVCNDDGSTVVRTAGQVPENKKYLAINSKIYFV